MEIIIYGVTSLVYDKDAWIIIIEIIIIIIIFIIVMIKFQPNSFDLWKLRIKVEFSNNFNL